MCIHLGTCTRVLKAIPTPDFELLVNLQNQVHDVVVVKKNVSLGLWCTLV